MAELTLYAIPFACSLAPHIALREAALPHRMAWVARGSLAMASGENFLAINPKGKVATLQRCDGSILTENVAILLELATPSVDHARLVEWLTFVSTELHKQILWAYFDPFVPEAMKTHVIEALLPKVLSHPEAALAERPFLLGEVSVADAYLFWSSLLIMQIGVRLEAYPALLAFHQRMKQRPAVREVLAIEQRAFTDV